MTTIVAPGLVELLDQGQDGLPGCLIQVAGRLVGEHDRGAGRPARGRSRPLALAAGELCGQRVRASGQPTSASA